MKIKEWIKSKTFGGNIYWLDRKYRIDGRKQERLTKKIISEVTEIDCIQNFDIFRKKILPYTQTKQFISHACIGSESCHYGHINAFFHYAGVEEKVNTLLFPAIEHAVRYKGKVLRSKEEIERYTNMVYQSAYCKDDIHAINKNKPVFCVGPYIHYADYYYNEEELQRIKVKYGKILLVFPTHYMEDKDFQYMDDNLVDAVFELADGVYDTVMVSAYWGNLEWKIYKDFEERGALLVSSGYREDPEFLKRLKTLLYLADMVVSNTIASPWGFCLAMNKPFQYIAHPKENLGEVENFEVNKEDFAENYLNLKRLASKKQRNEAEQKLYDDLYTYYCGSPEDIRTSEEMRAIISIAEELLEYSKGYFDKYDMCVMHLLKKYEQSGDILKERLLKESLM